MRHHSIGRQIERFLQVTFQKTQPAWIVTVERKGTALLRTFVNSPSGRTHEWPGWARVLSSHALNTQGIGELLREKGNILLLDDGAYGGRRISSTLRLLVAKGVPPERIKTAAFSVYEGCPSRPDFCWFGRLGADRYRAVRTTVVTHFQQQGSLLLNTEHIEVPVEIRCGRLEFFDALCRAGIGVEHVSGGGRLNLTIYNPFLVDKARFLDRLPTGTTIRNVVRKLRVVERAKNQFVIIPIFYPSTPADCSTDSLSRIDDCLRTLAADAETNFHLVGVFAAMNLFQSAFACLRDLVMEGRVRVRVPGPEDPDDPISHMKALFPGLDIERMRHTVKCYIEAGRKRKLARKHLREPRRIEAVDGTRYADELTRLHWLTLREILRLSTDAPVGPRGATLGELLRIVRDHDELLVGEALLSAAHDQAIDAANVVTDDAVMPFSDARRRNVRVFRLDGEMVTSDARMAAAAWRQPSTPPACRERDWQWT